MINPYLGPFSGESMSLDEVIGIGNVLIQSAVEAVIARHGREIMEVEIKLAADKKIIADDFARGGNRSASMQAAMSARNADYIDNLILSQQQSLGCRNDQSLGSLYQGAGSNQLERSGQTNIPSFIGGWL